MKKNIKLRVKNLIQKYGTTDPYKLCQKLGIEVIIMDLGVIKGCFKSRMGEKVILINSVFSAFAQKIILAHELGHYLGLHHVFAETDNGTCEDTDYCKDTPSYNRSEYEQWLNNLDKQNKYQLKDLAKRYSCEKGEYEAHNIMDYAYCFYNEITLEQRKRIRHILNYSPLIPGPKESRIDTRGVQGRLNLPICIMK